jgi:hypothetical protein
MEWALPQKNKDAARHPTARTFRRIENPNMRNLPNPLQLRVSEVTMAKNRQKSAFHKNRRNLWKSRIFPLTLPTSKPHGNHRQGSS